MNRAEFVRLRHALRHARFEARQPANVAAARNYRAYGLDRGQRSEPSAADVLIWSLSERDRAAVLSSPFYGPRRLPMGPRAHAFYHRGWSDLGRRVALRRAIQIIEARIHG